MSVLSFLQRLLIPRPTFAAEANHAPMHLTGHLCFCEPVSLSKQFCELLMPFHTFLRFSSLVELFSKVSKALFNGNLCKSPFLSSSCLHSNSHVSLLLSISCVVMQQTQSATQPVTLQWQPDVCQDGCATHPVQFPAVVHLPSATNTWPN